MSHPAEDCRRRLVIVRLVVVDLFLKGYILSGVKAVFVQQQQRQQAGHSAVAVPERVDAEKVQYHARDQEKLIDIRVASGIQIGKLQLLHGFGGLACRRGAETDATGFRRRRSPGSHCRPSYTGRRIHSPRSSSSFRAVAGCRSGRKSMCS